MSTTETTDVANDPERSFRKDRLVSVRYHLRGWRGPAILGALAISALAALNWNWLLAIGIAPLIVGALPCVAMCALGFCMSKRWR